jgi:hypothetical protein
MFGEIDEAHLSAMVQHLDHAFASFQPGRDGPKRDIAQLVQQALPADDSSLQWSPTGGGVTGDPADTLNGAQPGRAAVSSYHGADAVLHCTDV